MSEEHIAFILKYTIKVSPYETNYKHVPRHIETHLAAKTKDLPVQLSTAESIGDTLNANSIVLGDFVLLACPRIKYCRRTSTYVEILSEAIT